MADAMYESLLNKTAVLYRPSVGGTPNEFGERESTPGSEIATIKVCMQPYKDKYQLEFGGYKFWVELVVYTTFLDVRDADIIELESKKYMVVSVENEGGQDHHLKVFVVKQ